MFRLNLRDGKPRQRRVRAAAFVTAMLGTWLAQSGIAQPGPDADSDARVDVHLENAKRAEADEDYQTAAAEYEAIVALRPDWALIRQSLGVTYHLSKRYEEAIEQFSEAVLLDGQLWGAYLFLGMDYYQTHDFAAAILALGKSLALNPDLLETRRWLGMSHAAAGQHELAIQHLAQVAEAMEGDVEALFHLARTYDRRAEALFESVGRLEPASAFVHLLQAERFLFENEAERARVEYRLAVALRPDLASAVESEHLEAQALSAVPSTAAPGELAAAREAYVNGAFRLAAEEAKSVFGARPESIEAMYWLGRSYKGLAASTLERLVAVAPASYRVDQLRAEIHASRTEFAKAVEAYRRALDKRPQLPGLRYALGVVYWRMGRFSEARTWLAAEIERNPHHALARHRLGNLLLDGGEASQALPHLLQALAVNPSLSEARFDLGRAYLETEDFAAAAREFEGYADAYPRNDRVRFLLASAYRGLGRTDDARRELEAYQRLSRERLRKVQADVRSVSEDLRDTPR